ncbi:MAG: AAA family ATPase [Thermoplasmata archaeon]|nr:AAA family ATPase [Thermoplasmata archaeon]
MPARPMAPPPPPPSAPASPPLVAGPAARPPSRRRRIGKVLLVVGLVLAVVGAVLLFVPVVAQPSQTVQTTSSTPYVAFTVSGFSLTGSIPVSVSWTSTASVTVLAAACSAQCSGNPSSISGLTTQTGTSGKFTLNQPDGGAVVLGALNVGGAAAAVTFKVTTALTSIGSILLIVGILLLVVGILRWSRKAEMPAAAMAAAPTGAPGAPQPLASAPAGARPGARPLGFRGRNRVFWAFLVAGLILLGVGAGLEGTFYPYVANAQSASAFLASAHAVQTSDPSVQIVTISGSSVAAGTTIVLQDTVSSVSYNAATGTTSLGFQSIANLPAGVRSQQSALAAELFGTVQGAMGWVTTGSPIVMTFTVVRAQFPGGPYNGQSYLTLDAQADATYAALQHGVTGPAAVAVGQQYFQPYPAPLYDDLFIFLAALGGLLVAVGYFFSDKIARWLLKETKEPKHVGAIVMGITALLGGTFVPFYPWPAVLFIAVAVFGVAWRFPQLSLLILVLLVAPEVGYQSGAMGFVFLFAAIPVLFAGLLDWRFGLGAFLTLFLAPLGLSFAVPIFLALIFSLSLGIAVAVAGGVLISLFVTLGNLPVLGYLVGPGSSSTGTLIAGHAAALNPVLPLPYFSFNAIGAAYGNIVSPNLATLGQGGVGLGAIAIPLAEVVVWCVVAWLLVRELKDREHQETDRLARYSSISGGLLAVTTFAAVATFGYMGWWNLALLLFIPAMLTVAAGSLVTRDAFEAYFTSRLGGSSVGTRVAEMKGLTKVTFEMVGGLHDVKADIKESLVIPLMRRDVTARFKLEPPKGILLFGPPGCGKTMLMKALASELGVEMISIKSSDLMSKWYGESENRIAELLRTARERAPSILFMDEIDAIAKRRDMYTADDVTPRLLSILLAELDGIDKSVGVIVVGSTNKPDLIDPALMRPGRLDKIVYVPPPDFNERIEILHVHLVGRPVKRDVDLAEIAKKTERYSGADLANLVREAATIAVRRQMTSGVVTPITMDDFRHVLPKIKPSISLRVIAEYETMKLDYERKMHQAQRMERKIVVHWDDVGGLADIKQAIREYVELPLTRPELMESYRIKTGRGILLFGPPGCGKTHVMRAAANELNIAMQIVAGPELVTALAGQSEAAVRDVLYRARENAPSLVFFDEIDALASKESMRTPEVSRAVSQFLTEMDGLRPKDKVIVIATTNRPHTLDPALLRPGRFDKIFYVPPPDDAARLDIFRIHLKGVPIEGTLQYEELAQRSAGFSGADIAAVVDDSKLIALREEMARERSRAAVPAGAAALFAVGTTPGPAAPAAQTAVVGVRMSNLLEALAKTRSSITPETLRWAQDFIRDYGTRS